MKIPLKTGRVGARQRSADIPVRLRAYSRAVRQECRRSAFSLIELMIVVIVIGIIAATIAPRIVGTTHDARVSSAQASVGELRSALERFYIHLDRYPSNEEGLNALMEAPPGSQDQWRGPYIERLRPDPWGNPFQYRIPGTQNRPFDLWSRGADGVDGGEGKGADIW